MSIRRCMSGLSPTPSFFGVFKVIISSVHFPTWEMTLAWSPAYPEHFPINSPATLFYPYPKVDLQNSRFKGRGPRGDVIWSPQVCESHINKMKAYYSIVVASFHAYLPQCQASMSKDCLSLGVKKLQHSDNSKIWIKTSSFATGALTRGWQHKYFAGFPACYFIPILAISFITSVWIHLACIHCLYANVPLWAGILSLPYIVSSCCRVVSTDTDHGPSRGIRLRRVAKNPCPIPSPTSVWTHQFWCLKGSLNWKRNSFPDGREHHLLGSLKLDFSEGCIDFENFRSLFCLGMLENCYLSANFVAISNPFFTVSTFNQCQSFQLASQPRLSYQFLAEPPGTHPAKPRKKCW